MKKVLLVFVAILATNFLVCAQSAQPSAQPTKVACVGNSITYGAFIANREKNSYPAQLQYFLGDQYQVRNFGANARTLLSKGDLPYVNSDEYKASLAWQPDVVLIKLGTNDAKDFNCGKLGDYVKDYQALIDSYRAVNKDMRIVLLKPVYCYLLEGVFANADSVYTNVIIPSLEQLAYDNGVEIVDMYHVFDNKWAWELLPDRLHPSSLGATMVAARAGNVVELEQGSEVKKVEGTKFNFHGFEGVEFGGGNKIVSPKRVAAGAPWVLRARFWGHEPQTDIALLERGYHIAYCDVANMYGSPKAVKKHDAFYKQMTALGLNKKVVLEGMSRGGLIAFNWAAANADKVVAIYGDAPVLDLKSWPMGKGGNADDTKMMMAAYGFKTKEQATAWRKNPVDQVAKLKNIPIMLVVGDADQVVPVAENSAIFEREIPNIKVIHKDGVGHHPHSLFAPSPIVDFIVQATGQWKNPCVRAVPGGEFRSGAGWVEGNDWHTVADEISDVLGANKVDLLLLGNSITQAMGGHLRKNINTFWGRDAMDKYTKDWESAGISGDRTQNLLWRLQNGNYGKCNPSKVVIAIGVNNVIAGDSASDIEAGIVAVTNQAVKDFPNAKILLIGLLPVGQQADDARRVVYNQIHELLAKESFADNVIYRNPTAWFTDENGNFKEGLYGGDAIHLGGAGYDVWCANMAKELGF